VGLDDAIPEHEYSPEYGPTFRLGVPASKMADQNVGGDAAGGGGGGGYLDGVCEQILQNIERYIPKPAAGADAC
jgi:hypothetical protein